MINDFRANVFELRAALLRNGLSLADVARINGFNYRTVIKVIERYWGREGARPRGKVTLDILDALKRHSHGSVPPSATESGSKHPPREVKKNHKSACNQGG